MAISDITPAIRKEDGNGYDTLRKAIVNSNVKKITKRDAVFLLNKQFEGISETFGNIYIYMFYYSCTDAISSKFANSLEWYNQVRANDGTKESTPWCACYTSFVLNMAGITSTGHWNAAFQNAGTKIGLDQEIKDFNQAKSMDLVSYGYHVGFAVKEDNNKKNNYNQTLYTIGGNQGDSVGLSFFNNPVAFGRNSEYEKEINAGDFLSVLGYFVNANLKTPEERKKELQSRIDKSNKLEPSTKQSTQITITRLALKEISSVKENGLYIQDATLRERMKELITFEDSLIQSNIPTTQNVSAVQDPNRAGSTT